MNRRDVIDPRRLAHTAGQVLAVLEEPPIALVQREEELTLLRFGRKAMATGFEIALPFGTPDALAAAEDALDLVNRLEAQMTVYREDSDISRINRHAAISAMPVEPRLFALLDLARQIHHETDGAYDIAVGALIKTWGFFRRQGRVPTDEERASALEHCGMRHVVLDTDRQTIHFRQRGIELNLGSIGKGYALDRVAERLRTQDNIHSALLHGGSSSVLGVGMPPGQQRGWPVGLGHPTDMNKRLGVVWLKDRALGTSSVTFQHLRHNGRKLGHILDPRTGWPAEQLASASAVAPTAAQADALATAFFVLGVEQTRVYCQKHPQAGAVLLPHGRAVPVVIGNVDFTQNA
ncbi:MAG TPA: FAD:protein FMN transferase [Gemmataceae bacterium]|nr:FAD:protein FMN transferase [Gemmataceae bacterium]